MTKIPYCDETWNVTAGCTKCSPGCKHCWAERLHTLRHIAYNKGKKMPVQYKKSFSEIQLLPKRLDKPLHWREPRRIFVNSMSDLFHPKVPFEFIDKVYVNISDCRQHTFLVFTKRVEIMLEYHKRRTRIIDVDGVQRMAWIDWPIPNLIPILSLSTQAEADEKIPILLQMPAAVRGLSLEPLLEGIELRPSFIKGRTQGYESVGVRSDIASELAVRSSDLDGIKWAVVGCESGPKRRPCKIEWVRSIVQQCQAAGVPVYVKQLSINGKVSRKMDEWPKDLRIQKYP